MTSDAVDVPAGRHFVTRTTLGFFAPPRGSAELGAVELAIRDALKAQAPTLRSKLAALDARLDWLLSLMGGAR